MAVPHGDGIFSDGVLLACHCSRGRFLEERVAGVFRCRILKVGFVGRPAAH